MVSVMQTTFKAGEAVAAYGARAIIEAVLPDCNDGEGNTYQQAYRVRIFNGCGPDRIETIRESELSKATW